MAQGHGKSEKRARLVTLRRVDGGYQRFLQVQRGGRWRDPGGGATGAATVGGTLIVDSGQKWRADGRAVAVVTER